MADEHYEIELTVKTEGTEQSTQKLRAMEQRIQQTEKRARMLNKAKISPAARLNDMVTGPARKIESRLNELSKKTVGISVEAKISNADRAIDGLDIMNKAQKTVKVPVRITEAGDSLSILQEINSGKFTQPMDDILAEMANAQGATKKVASEFKSLASNADNALSVMQKVQAPMSKMEKMKSLLGKVSKIKAMPIVELKDKVTAPAAKIESKLKSLGNKTVSVVIKAKDMASSAISKVTSPLAILGAGAGVYGAGELTLGSAMYFENQMVSMEHWLKGNTALTKEYVGWLDKFAAATPFEMDDLFPAGARAIGVAEGDVKLAERIVKMATDMASLNPGKTVSQAMEAIADASMGEYERMKEFGMKFDKDDKGGGILGFLSKAEERFAGGAEKLSRTTTGRLSTITDTIKSLFREAGTGMIQALKPRLEKINEWFDRNPDKVRMWKTRLQSLGQEAFEGLLTSGKRIMDRIEARFNDPQFQSMTWSQKVGAMIDEVITEVTPTAKDAAVKLGTAIGEGIWGAAEAALENHPLVKMALLGFAGYKVAGPWGAFTGAMSVPTQAAVDVGINKLDNSITANENAYHKNVRGAILGNPEGGYAKPLGGEAFISHASGGMFDRPHFGLVAEAGPEVIIPLSTRMRTRAFDLWQQAGEYMGVRPYASGGFAGPVPVAMAGAGGGNLNLNVQAPVSLSLVNDFDEDALALKIGRQVLAQIIAAIPNKG